MPLPDAPFRPNFGNEDRNFPKLPEFRTSIQSLQLKKRAVTHSSIPNKAEHDDYERYGRTVFSWSSSIPDPLSRLEHLGDSVLEMFVTRLLYELYPNVKVGDAHVSIF